MPPPSRAPARVFGKFILITMPRQRPGKEHASSSGGNDRIPLPHRPPVGTSVTPSAPARSDDQVPSPAHDSDIPVSSSSTVPHGALFIEPRGLEFTNQLDCAHHIAQIIERWYDNAWKSWRSIPREVRDMWFGEWQKRYTWREEDAHQIRKNFERLGSNNLRNKLHRARSSATRPTWIGQEVWDSLLNIWRNERFQQESEQNKRNRAAECDGDGFPLHMGGCVSFGEHVQRMTKELGHQPTITDSFLRLHSKQTKEGERVWVNELAKKSHETHTQRMNDISSQSSNTEEGEPEDRPTELEVWTEIVGGPKKGRLRGLGSQGSYSSRSSSYTSGVDLQHWQTEKRQLLNRVENYENEFSRLSQSHSKQQEEIAFLKTQLTESQALQQQSEANQAKQQESQAKQQEDIAFLKSQFAMLQQQQQQVGGSSYYPPPARPPNSGRGYASHNRSRLARFMPTPGGSSSSCDAPPADPPLNEDPADDDDGEQDFDDV